MGEIAVVAYTERGVRGRSELHLTLRLGPQSSLLLHHCVGDGSLLAMLGRLSKLGQATGVAIACIRPRLRIRLLFLARQGCLVRPRDHLTDRLLPLELLSHDRVT